jgi:hypothetical protein
MRQKTTWKAGTRIYYAQVKTPAGQPPTTRILEGKILRKAKRVGTWRAAFEHAKMGIDVHAEWCTTDHTKAAPLLRRRVEKSIRYHTLQASMLLEALATGLNDLLVIWPAGESTRDPEHLHAG